MKGVGRIHWVSVELPPYVVGGLGRYVERMAAALAATGTRVEMYGFASLDGGMGRSSVGSVGMTRMVRAPRGAPDGAGRAARAAAVIAAMATHIAFGLRSAIRILRAENRAADPVVVVHDWMGCLTGILCAILGRRRVVFHLHSAEHGDAEPPRRDMGSRILSGLEDLQARVADRIVVPTERMRTGLIERGWAADRITVVPHGVEDPELDRVGELPDEERNRVVHDIRSRYLPDPEDALLLYAGRMAPHKGIDTLLLALPGLLHVRPDLILVIVTQDTAFSRDSVRVAELITTLGLESRVRLVHRFLPSRELFEHIVAADVCIYPSRYEPFGLIAVESMALGRPVVVGPGYSAEVVGAGVDAALRCSGPAVDELGALVAGCLTDRDGAERRGHRSRDYVTQRFRWSETARLSLEIYRRTGA